MNIQDSLHVLLFIILIFLPLITGKNFKKKYGIYVSYFMTFVILGWLFNNGKCLLPYENKSDPKYKHGLTPVFLNEYLNLNPKYFKVTSTILGILYGVSAYNLGESSSLLQKFIVIITIVNTYINNK